MTKLIALMHQSFDGFAAGPNGEMNWITLDQEIFEHVAKFVARAGTGVYGPKTFQMMDSYWPGVLTDPQSEEVELKHARWYQTAKKVVCSHTLQRLENPEARLIHDVKVELEKLKQESTKDLLVFGSPRLTRSLARLGLLDELVINVSPILLGSGIRMFEDLPQTKLELLSATPFKSGVVGFHYAVKP